MSNASVRGALAEAQAWAEGWLGMQCIAEAAETRCSPGRPRKPRKKKKPGAFRRRAVLTDQRLIEE
jgi:hypothetical protein